MCAHLDVAAVDRKQVKGEEGGLRHKTKVPECNQTGDIVMTVYGKHLHPQPTTSHDALFSIRERILN